MLQIMFVCARTSQFVPTGIETDLDTFYRATRSSVAEPMFRVWSKPLLDQKRDLDFRFSAQMSRSTSRGCYPPTPLICGRAVAKLGPVNAGLFSVALVPLMPAERAVRRARAAIED